MRIYECLIKIIEINQYREDYCNIWIVSKQLTQIYSIIRSIDQTDFTAITYEYK